jgi:hypothetical protein
MANTTRTGKSEHEERMSNAGEKASQAVSYAKDAAKEVASDVKEGAKSAASTVAEYAGHAASAVGKKADDAVSATGSGMQSLAGTVRDKGPHSGVLGKASSAVASTLESTGEYLEEKGLSGMGKDLTDLIRRHPIPALLIGVGVGYLISQATRS